MARSADCRSRSVITDRPVVEQQIGPETFEYRPGFLGRDHADGLLQYLWRGVVWHQDPIVMFGRRVLQPRLTAWFGDAGARYRYSGLDLEPDSWPRRLAELKDSLQRELEQSFNSVLVNAYRDGRDCMGWHADDEPELGPVPTIASLSLGATRRFLIRRGNGGPSTPMDLEHGSLLVMRGDAQSRYRHAVPRTARPVGLRINLTFRHVRQA
ncbi:alpha-ketoglutarate-dependent dioxygenase AlkB family protein [Elongatibacter sediminis]|uniref:Alpha-ketoglutarate-dependent dioxygenase AlkB n=1 Tax=Elongatibacter sediminis TaxID=3119006 RepID=A0AAW9R6D9_9GAMM